MTKSNFTSLDVEGHDGSTAGLYIGGTLVTATAAELNRMVYETQAITVTGQAITVKNGVCTIAGAGILAALCQTLYPPRRSVRETASTRSCPHPPAERANRRARKPGDIVYTKV